MGIDVGATVAGLQALAIRVTNATEAIVGDVAHVFQAKAMELAPVGVPGNSTNAPGDLARSIEVEGPTGFGTTFVARVGPTVITMYPGPGGRVFNYGRQREFGGTLVPRVSATLAFSSFGQWFFPTSVHQEGAHYLLRARIAGIPAASAAIAARLTVAVEGG